MSTMKRAMAGLAAVLGLGMGALAQGGELLAAAGGERAPQGPDGALAVREREVAVDAARLAGAGAGDRVTLSFFGDAAATMSVDRVVTGAGGVRSWVGHVEGSEFSLGVITLAGGAGAQVSASVWMGGRAWGLAPTGRNDADGRPVCLARELTAAGMLSCAMDWSHPPIAPLDERAHRAAQAQLGAGGGAGGEGGPGLESPEGLPLSGACDCGDDQTVLDMLVVYTTLAKNAAGGATALRARVENAIQSANAAYIASGIASASGANRLAIRLAGFVEVSYDEQAPQWLDHLDRVTNPTDGILDNVHALRNQYNADTVSLIIDDARFTGGAAFYAVYSEASAFSTLNWRAEGSGSLTLAHETGHTFGCAHDRGNSSFGPFTYGWGYSFAASGTTYGTIMSYTGANLVPLFSNPTILHSSGQPVGAALSGPLPAYNALVISQTRWTLASYRDSGRIIDCNGNGLDDAADLAAGRSADANHNCRPDECEYRLYVDASNTGTIDGLSWATAYKDLGEALAFASMKCSNVSEIWVAGGVYRPDRGSADRYASFAMRSGLAIYGGFRGKNRPGGGETSLAQRALGVSPSVLSGDIGAAGVDTDNSFNVVVADTTDATAVLDGFTIERGYQDFGGGGMYVSNARPTVRNCLFRSNRGGSGAALTIVGAQSGAGVSDCVFSGNTALGSGGAVSVNDGGPTTFARCTFAGCAANFGGAVSVYNGGQASFASCTFDSNTAQINSGAIDSYLNCRVTLTGCVLENNRAATGGAGAVLAHTGCTLIAADCRLEGNSAPGGTGGGMWIEASTATLDRLIVRGNSCGFGGGGVSCYGGSNVTVTGSTLDANRGAWGGGVAAADSTLDLRACGLYDNGALSQSGGGIDLYNNATTLSNCAIAGNTSADGGAGVSLGSGSSLTAGNCTIYANRAGNSGGGIGMFNATLSVRNSILYANTAGSGWSLQDQQLTVFSGTRTVSRSCVQGLNGSLGGAGNIGGAPMLADPAGRDFGLLAGSPCIDAGDNGLAPAGVTTDLLGHARFVDEPGAPNTGVAGGAGAGAIVDMGAVENQGPANCRSDFNGDGFVDPDDLSDYIACYFAVPACPGADFNGDGVSDPDDLSDYIAAFFGGCP